MHPQNWQGNLRRYLLAEDLFCSVFYLFILLFGLLGWLVGWVLAVNKINKSARPEGKGLGSGSGIGGLVASSNTKWEVGLGDFQSFFHFSGSIRLNTAFLSGFQNLLRNK